MINVELLDLHDKGIIWRKLTNTHFWDCGMEETSIRITDENGEFISSKEAVYNPATGVGLIGGAFAKDKPEAYFQAKDQSEAFEEIKKYFEIKHGDSPVEIPKPGLYRLIGDEGQIVKVTSTTKDLLFGNTIIRYTHQTTGTRRKMSVNRFNDLFKAI